MVVFAAARQSGSADVTFAPWIRHENQKGGLGVAEVDQGWFRSVGSCLLENN